MTQNRKFMAILITLVVVIAQFAALPLTAYAAPAGTAKIVLIAPDNVVLGDNDLQVTMKRGVPSGNTESAVNGLTTIPSSFVTTKKLEYLFTEPGLYTFYSRGPGYYRIFKVFNVYQDQIDNGEEIEIVIPNGPLGAEGYQPASWQTFAERKAPDYEGDDYIPQGASADSREVVVGIYPDEVRAVFGLTDEAFENQRAASKAAGLDVSDEIPYPLPFDGNDPDQHFDTPTFNNLDELGMLQIARHEMVEEYIEDKMENFVQGTGGVYAYYDSMGTTPFYELSMPIVVFAKEAGIAECTTLEEVADIVRENDKPTVWHQGAIHANEPAATEAVMAMMSDLFGDYGADILDSINIVLIPRVSVESSRIYSRANILGVDPNRGHLNADSLEQNYIHQAFQLFMPEVAQDGHEFTFYGISSSSYLSNTDDIQTTEAGQMNVSDELQEFSVSMNTFVQQKALDSGLRVVHYGPAVSPGVGRAYYNMLGTCTILVETRGIGGGGGTQTHLPRRTYSQYVAGKAIDEYTAENAEEVLRVTRETRESLVNRGKTYDPDDLISLDYPRRTLTYTAETSPIILPRFQYNLDGTLTRAPVTTGSAILGTYYNTEGKNRSRPTAYIIPKDAPNLDSILYVFDQQLIRYFEIAPGATVDKVSQYYWISGTGIANWNAGLREEGSTIFKNGAIVVPMDQVNSAVIAMTMEPDFNDSSSYRTTLVQQNLMTYDRDDNNYPLYRYQGDNPSESIGPVITPDIRLTTGAHLVQDGEYFTLNAYFTEEKSSNAAILTYTFDGDKFEYANFAPATGVSAVNIEYEAGKAKITVATMGSYEMKEFGEIMLRAKEDAGLTDDFEKVVLEVQYVLKDEAGDKELKEAATTASFTTWGGGPGPDGFTLIDLSNIIDWIGITDSDPQWKTLYTFWDFNNNGEIDIADISYVAKQIK